MQDDYRWMPAAMFEMAATCRKEGMTAACNLLTESAILLHICLAQKQDAPQDRNSARNMDNKDDNRPQLHDAVAALDRCAGALAANVSVLRPRVDAQQNGRAQL